MKLSFEFSSAENLTEFLTEMKTLGSTSSQPSPTGYSANLAETYRAVDAAKIAEIARRHATLEEKLEEAIEEAEQRLFGERQMRLGLQQRVEILETRVYHVELKTKVEP